MRITGHGHAAVRATHAKTLELTPDASITERATCVVGVATTVTPARPLAGPVRITVEAGGASFALHARANPLWDPAGPAVVRRSPLRLPGTLATHADAAADDLPPDLVAALRDPSRAVVVDVEPIPGPPTVVLLGPAASDAALAAELDAADVVVAEDAGARERVGRGDPPPAVVDGRVLVVATDDLPGATVPLAGVLIETVGLAPRAAAAAACPSRAPVAFLGAANDIAEVPAGYRLVLPVAVDALERALARARDVRGTALATLAQHDSPPLAHRIGDPLRLPGRDLVHCCLHPADTALDPRVGAALDALLADGVPTRSAAKALAELTGWPRRRAYDLVLERSRVATT